MSIKHAQALRLCQNVWVTRIFPERLSMPKPPTEKPNVPRVVQRALLRWENEGGSPSDDASNQPSGGDSSVPELTNAELVRLQIRVIALENLVVALLADASGEQLAKVREIGLSISPRPGVEHRLTVHATAQMEHLARRAMRV